MSESIDVTVEEDEAMECQFPWCCYTDHALVQRRFRTLDELCEKMGMDKKHVQDIIEYLNGLWGGFIIYQQTKFVRN